jgi:hypothetical protein
MLLQIGDRRADLVRGVDLWNDLDARSCSEVRSHSTLSSRTRSGGVSARGGAAHSRSTFREPHPVASCSRGLNAATASVTSRKSNGFRRKLHLQAAMSFFPLSVMSPVRKSDRARRCG